MEIIWENMSVPLEPNAVEVIVKSEYHAQRQRAEKGGILEREAVKEDQIADLGI